MSAGKIKSNYIGKLLKYDVKNGFNDTIYKIGIFIALCIFEGMIAAENINCYTGDSRPTIGDYFCVVIGGPKHIENGMLDMYVIPVLWLIIYAMIAYIIGYYGVRDLYGYGVQVLIRSKKRHTWWKTISLFK